MYYWKSVFRNEKRIVLRKKESINEIYIFYTYSSISNLKVHSLESSIPIHLYESRHSGIRAIFPEAYRNRRVNDSFSRIDLFRVGKICHVREKKDDNSIKSRIRDCFSNLGVRFGSTVARINVSVQKRKCRRSHNSDCFSET